MAYTTINDPSAYFQTKIYTGNNTDGTQITNDGSSNLQPDWLWIKNRTDSGGAPATGGLWDSVRGFAENKVLTTFSTNGEGANSNGFAVATTDGFTVEDGTSGANPRTATNLNAKNYVAWQWKAGTSFTNDASSTGIGSIDSTGSVSDTSGFSIVSYTGTGANGTVKHGLSTAPNWIIFKNRETDGQNWIVYHSATSSTPADDFLKLNATSAVGSSTSYGNNTAPTTSVFSVGANDNTNKSSVGQIAYCFAEKQGYSKFGSYTGNGNADGTFVYTGFKPAWIMQKETGNTRDWTMIDNTRSLFNAADDRLVPNTSDAEVTNNITDLLSNGFKMRNTQSNTNSNGGSYIYMAFAENPFVTSTGVPATAR